MNRKTWFQLAVIPMFAALALGSSSPKKKGAADDTAGKTETTGAAIKQASFFGGSEWTILDVVDRGSPMKGNDSSDKDATTTGRFIQVHYRVANLGKKEGTVGRSAAKLADERGREFGSIDRGSDFVPKNGEILYLETIQPSLSKEFYAIYEVPADAGTLSFKVTDFGFSSSTRTIALGDIPRPVVAAASASAPAKGAAPAPVKAAGAAPAAKPAAAPAAAKAKAAPPKK
jgi:hypothetical protein